VNSTEARPIKTPPSPADALWVITRRIRTLRRRRQARFERAIIECSTALLRDDEASVRDALEALLVATGASSVFVERNVEDPERGFCSTLVEEVLAPGVEPDPPDRWTLVPWSEMPMSFEHLSRGRAFEFRPQDLPPEERARYEGIGVRTELDIPIFVGSRWLGLIGFTDVRRAGSWTSADRSLLRTAAQLIGRHWEATEGRTRVGEAIATLDRQLRYQSVLAESSRRLLSGGGEGAIDAVLEALVDVSGADYVYVDRNFTDPELGLCCEIVHEAVRDPSVPFGEHRWRGGPYRDLPTTYGRLSRGAVSFIRTRELQGAERAQYEADGIRSELNLPITVGGRWVGSIAFASYREERCWDDHEVSLLRTAAEMIGAHWGRTEQNQRLAQTLSRLEDRYRLEQALTRSARALLNDEPEAIDATIRELLAATGVDLVYVDENHDDPERGLCWRVTHHVGRAEPPTGGVWAGPYADLPTVRAALEKGRPAVIHTASLEGREREIYESDGVRSELSLPIRVEGVWRGSLGLDHYRRERDWTDEDIELLSTAAEMIGAYWHRRETRERLERLISSKDEFLASVGHELRTPLTSVLGFAEILVEDGERLSAVERREMLELVAREARDAAWIIEDLLAFARSDLGRLQVAPAAISLLDEAEAVIRSLPSGVPIELRGDDVKAWADAARVRQIIRNLLTNAIKYGGPSIVVEVDRGEGSARLAVLDDGDGIPSDLQDLVFQPYVRLQEEAGQPGSMGLGLSVSRQLARLLGGDLRYLRREGFSVFELSLPEVAHPKR